MTVKSLDHVNIQTLDVAGTARFFTDVLDLAARPPVPGLDPDQITWMWDRERRPIVHITRPGHTFADEAEKPIGTDTGPIHHVAFECEGHAAMLARLKSMDLSCRTRDISQIGLRQIFVHEPNGVVLELNYCGN
jgi:catechol 2,3-dioxygenase-like lactoylglutathione lyase family enzyme